MRTFHLLAMLSLCPLGAAAAMPLPANADSVDIALQRLVSSSKVGPAVKTKLTGSVARDKHFARALVEHDGELTCAYVRIFPSGVRSDIIEDFMRASVNREFFRYGATNSPTIKKALARYKFPEAFGPIPAYAMIRVVKGRIPAPKHFNFSYKEGIARATASIQASAVDLGVIKAVKKKELGQHYISTLLRAARSRINRGDYDFVLQLLDEAKRHGDQSYEGRLRLLECHLGLNNTKRASEASLIISKYFLSRVDQATCQNLIFLAAGNCNYEETAIWEKYMNQMSQHGRDTHQTNEK